MLAVSACPGCSGNILQRSYLVPPDYRRLALTATMQYQVTPESFADRHLSIHRTPLGMNRKRLKRLLLIQKYLTFCIEWELGFEKETKVEEDRMIKWFAYSHLPEHLQAHSKPFGELADKICQNIQSGPERTVALRKLLEAKDAAVRAALNPGC